jgi:CRP-like cAMP-binding protein
MSIEGLERIVSEHRFFVGLDQGFCDLVAGCCKNARFDAGQFLLREGTDADQLYLIRDGRVALQISSPERGDMMFQTVGDGEVDGVSWLIPPYRWRHDAKALVPVRAIAVDTRCLRNKCESDHHLGYEMMKRFVPVLIERLHATRMQILDVYGASK